MKRRGVILARNCEAFATIGFATRRLTAMNLRGLGGRGGTSAKWLRYVGGCGLDGVRRWGVHGVDARAIELGCNLVDIRVGLTEMKSEQLIGKIVREFKENTLESGAAQTSVRGHKDSAQNRRWPSRRDFTLDDCYPPV